MILSCNHISKSYGVETVLDDCSFFINDYEKAALVGNNGAGKSTIFKIIMGELSSDSGTVTIGKDKTIGYLAQYQDLSSNHTIYEEVIKSWDYIKFYFDYMFFIWLFYQKISCYR